MAWLTLELPPPLEGRTSTLFSIGFGIQAVLDNDFPLGSTIRQRVRGASSHFIGLAIKSDLRVFGVLSPDSRDAAGQPCAGRRIGLGGRGIGHDRPRQGNVIQLCAASFED